VFLYYASFIPGLQNFTTETVKKRLPDVKIRKLLDGAVIFETEISYDKLNFFCFNNIFACLSIMEQQESTDALETHIKSVIRGNYCDDKIIATNSKNIRTFRIVISRENKPSAIDDKLRLQIEKLISGISGLKVNRTLPDTEFWFLYRREENPQENNFSVFMKRLTLRSSWEKTLHKGELPPPLAWTLCRLARLTHSDVVLDPFCGYGSIPQEAIKHFHITKFIACDNNKQSVLFSAEKFKKQKTGEFIIHQADFSALTSLTSEKSIDAIVTDPPWGQYCEIKDDAFLEKMFEVFGKLLKDGGRAVVLYAKDDEFLQAVPDFFTLENSIPVLLSGKKAVIYQFIRK
jgi:16S rRNA G966 N2-methylase RsmD